MKKLNLLIVIFLAFVLTLAVAFAQRSPISVPNGYWRGHEWRAAGERQRVGYATGLLDGILLANAFATQGSPLEWVWQCIGEGESGKRSDQLEAIFQKQIQDHPENWNEPMHVIGLRALMDVCPQSPKKLEGQVK